MDLVDKHIAEKNAERAVIAARRQAGGGEADDAGKLALIALDREGLLVELERCRSPLIEARTAHSAAADVMAAREQGLASEMRHAKAEAIIAFLRKADVAMLDGVGKLAALHSGGLP